MAIIPNEKELNVLQKEANKTKSDNEYLLSQIYPENIGDRVIKAEEDISFVVQTAVAIFIQIFDFSNFSLALKPTEVMKYLSSLYKSFDNRIALYPYLTKVKHIGSFSMYIAGLFSEDESSSILAEQSIKFALDAFSLNEEINESENLHNSIQITIHTGGPLIAGVFGIDKPSFEVVGSIIDLTNQLQNTTPPGKIQISKETFDLVSSITDFEFQKKVNRQDSSELYFVNNQAKVSEDI